MTELEKYVINFFGVQPDEAAKIAANFKPLYLPKGKSFLIEGRSSNRIGFVESGLLREFSQIGGKEITKWISSPGYFTCDLGGFVFGSKSRWNIEALTDVDLQVISKSDFDNIALEIENWADLQKCFITKCFISLEERVVQHLSMTAEERYNAMFHFNKTLFNQVPLQYLASMLGMTPETLSRIRRKQS